MRSALATQLEELNRDIALIGKEGERERTDIERFLAREQAERDREIALCRPRPASLKSRGTSAPRRRPRSAEAPSMTRRITCASWRTLNARAPESNSSIAGEGRRVRAHRRGKQGRGHAHAHDHASRRRARPRRNWKPEATLIARPCLDRGAEDRRRRHRARGGAQRARRDGGRARCASPTRSVSSGGRTRPASKRRPKRSRSTTTQRRFLELARLRIEAERDVHIDQAKAMGSAAVAGADPHVWRRQDNTMDTIRGLFTPGLRHRRGHRRRRAVAARGLRQRLSANGISGPARPAVQRRLAEADLRASSTRSCRNICAPRRRGKCRSPRRCRGSRSTPATNEDLRRAVKVLSEFNQERRAQRAFRFDSVWNMINAVRASRRAESARP